MWKLVDRRLTHSRLFHEVSFEIMVRAILMILINSRC